MIEMTIVARDAAEIHVIADALQRIANIRRQEEIPTGEQDPVVPFPPEAISALAQTATLTVTEPPKRRGRPPKVKADEAAAEAAEERAAIQAEAEMPVAEPEQDDDIPAFEPPPAPAPAPAAPPLTLEAVRAKAASVSQAGKAAAVKALLTEMGAAKLTDLSADRYPEFIERLEAV